MPYMQKVIHLDIFISFLSIYFKVSFHKNDIMHAPMSSLK